MNTFLSFDARDLSAFISAMGWVQVDEAIKDGLYVFNHTDFARQQLVFPLDKRFADAEEMLHRAVTRLAEIYEWAPLDTVRRVEESNSEVLVSLVPNGSRHITTVPLLYALKVLEGHKQMLLSGAVANGRRQTHYSKTFVGDAKRMLEAARFRQTEEGSFIFKASCRLYEFENIEEPPLPLEDEPVAAPFVRRAMLNIGLGLEELVTSIHRRNQNKLIENLIQASEQGDEITSPVSSNFCDAVAQLRDREHPHAVELWVSWSPLLPPPPQAPRQKIVITPDDFPVIEDVAKALRPVEKPKRDNYLATVEKLEGTFNDKGQRQGNVMLLLLRDSEKALESPIQVRVTLDAPKYEEALNIHRTTQVMARVEGTIRASQRQPFEFDLESFRIISIGT